MSDKYNTGACFDFVTPKTVLYKGEHINGIGVSIEIYPSVKGKRLYLSKKEGKKLIENSQDIPKSVDLPDMKYNIGKREAYSAELLDVYIKDGMLHIEPSMISINSEVKVDWKIARYEKTTLEKAEMISIDDNMKIPCLTPEDITKKEFCEILRLAGKRFDGKGENIAYFVID